MAVAAPDASTLRPRLAAAYRDACAVELASLKPGNVHHHAGGHGMNVEDFIVSAAASADPLTKPGLGLGERVYRAVAATRAAVGCNTNLGIVLLCAPLVHAVLEPGASGSLRERVRRVLRRADTRDTEWVFRAIGLAAPGGLGTSDQHDVSGPADASLLRVMAFAAPRDRIARQYATGFADLFQRSVPLLERLRARWQDEAWAATAVFMDLLSCFPDTHIARKHGALKAAEVTRRAAILNRELARGAQPEQFCERLLQLDREFKQEGINPGASADLTVASLLILRLEPMCSACERIAGVPRVRGLRCVEPEANSNCNT